MSGNNLFHKADKSILLTLLGVFLFLMISAGAVLFAPYWVETNWVTPSSPYQKQMYEIADPNIYISTVSPTSKVTHTIYHAQDQKMLNAYVETEYVKITSSSKLERYITRYADQKVKLTGRLLLLRESEGKQALQEKLREEWENKNPNWRKEERVPPRFTLLELYDPGIPETFIVADSDGVTENWAEYDKLTLVEGKVPFDVSQGTIYVKNPTQYRVSQFRLPEGQLAWQYDDEGKALFTFEDLEKTGLSFMSRESLIKMGERIYGAEGCYYCHTDQTRTLVQDTVVNGLDYPAPPSAPNEYVYQTVTFPGTKRNGPDLSRVGIKRYGRDWHMSHFWSPTMASPGSIMPSFRHFFDFDPRGTTSQKSAVPNVKFEAIYQYLMTKGTRITAPPKAWWKGRDIIRTIDLIEGKLPGGRSLKKGKSG